MGVIVQRSVSEEPFPGLRCSVPAASCALGHQWEDSEEEEELGGGRLPPDQVSDFTSSVLAAISCWPYRVATVTVRHSAAN